MQSASQEALENSPSRLGRAQQRNGLKTTDEQGGDVPSIEWIFALPLGMSDDACELPVSAECVRQFHLSRGLAFGFE